MTHSRKILSQAGTSLADIYDVEGSVVGLEDLDVSEIKGVHDLGPTIQSERLTSHLVLVTTGAVNQSTAFNVAMNDVTDAVNRLLGVAVMADVGARVDFASIAIGDTQSFRETPIWVWDTNDDVVKRFSWVEDGVGPSTVDNLEVLGVTHLPQLLTRTGLDRGMPRLMLRGSTTAFGAGTVEVQAIYTFCRPNVSGTPAPGEPSSHGLPVPSW